MKAFADIKQSKKLAEILPIDSADMYFEPSAGFCTEPSEVKVGDIKYAHPRSVPCWSLAALVEQLPAIEGGKPLISLAPNGECDMSYIHALTVDCLYVHASNLLNACVEMILKLHEEKLL